MTYVCEDCGHLQELHADRGCGFKACACAKLCVPLSPREMEVLLAIVKGQTMKEATPADRSVKTFQKYQADLFRKLRIHRKQQLIFVALKLGLVQLTDVDTPDLAIALRAPRQPRNI